MSFLLRCELTAALVGSSYARGCLYHSTVQLQQCQISLINSMCLIPLFSFTSGYLWVLTVLMLFPEAEAMPIHDSSGEEEFIDDVPAATRTLLARHFQLMALAIELQRKADTWNTEVSNPSAVGWHEFGRVGLSLEECTFFLSGCNLSRRHLSLCRTEMNFTFPNGKAKSGIVFPLLVWPWTLQH